MAAVEISRFPRKIIILVIVLFCSSALMAISEVTDEWSSSCFNECLAGGAGLECDMDSIRFIGDQYARAARGEPYWETARGRKFASASECAEFRFSQLRAICPGAAEVLRKSMR